MRSVPYQPDPPQQYAPDCHATIVRLRRLAQLDSNRLDLSIELDDLASEIATRVARAGIVLQLLRETDLEIAALTACANGADA